MVETDVKPGRVGDIVTSVQNTRSCWRVAKVTRNYLLLGHVEGVFNATVTHSFPRAPTAYQPGRSVASAWEEIIRPATLEQWLRYYGEGSYIRILDAIERGAVGDLGQEELAA